MLNPEEEQQEVAYVVEKAGLHYAVIYERLNPITGGERRRWHRRGDRAQPQALACRLGDGSPPLSRRRRARGARDRQVWHERGSIQESFCRYPAVLATVDMAGVLSDR